jgi:hypothetical protein
MGWSAAAGALALAQDAAPSQPSSRWSLFHRDKTPAALVETIPADGTPVTDDGDIGPYPPALGTPPLPGPRTTGAPPPPPFYPAATPPAVAPPGPDRPPNGFTDPLPPDAENGFEPCPQPPGPCHPYYFGFDYIHWYVQKQPVPPLVTTGSLADPVPGALGQPDTRIVLGSVGKGGDHDGVRLMGAYDFDAQGVCGVEAIVFWIDRTSPTAQVSGNGSANSEVLTRPFFNVNTRQQDADPINIPGVMSGTFTATSEFYMTGAEANFRYLVGCSPATGARLTLLAGFLFLDLDEKLLINESLTDVPGVGAGGNRFFLNENFTAYNHFYGGQIGAEYDHHIGPVVLQFIGKCALGNNYETLQISGSTTAIESSGAVATNPRAALLVGPGNVGHFTDNEFAAVPHGQFKIAYEFNQNFRASVGYDALWISRVIRPGDQTNPNVNVQPVGGPPVAPLDPQFLGFHSSGLWAQGFSIGFECNF